MNVFVLCTGRCGSTTFAKACSHITNYTSGHETKMHLYQERGLEGIEKYPDNHIEVNNRLIYLAGWLWENYSNAFYVHLKRNKEDVIQSRVNHKADILFAQHRITWYEKEKESLIRDIARLNVDITLSNIEYFLQRVPKSQKMIFDLEEYKKDWPIFLYRIDAKGEPNFAFAGRKEFETKYNSFESKMAKLAV